MTLLKNADLKTLNTFGVQATASRFFIAETIDHMRYALSLEKNVLILGGGSNILFKDELLDKLVIHNRIQGMHYLEENDDYIDIKVGSGVDWNEFVNFCTARNYAGLENLSLIPGKVGAAPMQNIGAYGVEVKDVIRHVEYMDISTGLMHTLQTEECEFGYRTSIFKTKLLNKIAITAVTFRLWKRGYQTCTSYGAIQEELDKKGKSQNPSIQDIAEVVVEIRNAKLPDPRKVGSAGSFFKNPIIPKEIYLSLPSSGEIPVFEMPGDMVKIPAGWLIEKCGWKGYREGDIGVYPKQALVLVNYGNGKGKDIFELAQKIILSVKQKFDLSLETEVNIL